MSPDSPLKAENQRPGWRAWLARSPWRAAQDQPVILGPYSPGPAPLRRRYIGLAVLLIACAQYGVLYALMAPSMMAVFAVPIATMAAVAVWALPSDLRRPPVKLVEQLFFGFLIALIVWPNYLAIALPGLPWITFVRLVGLPLILVFLICLSTSESVRSSLADVLRANGVLIRLLAVFVVIQTYSIALSHELGDSIDKYVTAQTTWTAIFFISTFVYLKEGRMARWAAAVWGAVLVVGVIAILEFRQRHLLWAGHIPSFIRVQIEDVDRIMRGLSRAGTDEYRAQATFSTALGLSEFNAIALPFIIYIALSAKRLVTRACAALTVPFMLYVIVLSGSRLGMIGACVTFLMYAFYWAFRRWRRQPRDIIGPTIVFAYPLLAVAFLAATIFVGRLHRIVWGGGETAASTEGRKIQYAMGIPKILTHPLGEGIGQGAVTLGYRIPSGFLTIDTYYLAVALEYGVLGFLVYYGMFLFVIGQSSRYILSTRFSDSDIGFLTPAAVSLANFVVIKAVFAQQDNHPMVFMILAMAAVMIYRLKDQEARAKPAR